MLKLVAALLTVKRAEALTVCVEIVGNDGATFTSWTMTVKEFVALNGGVPLSVTTTSIVFVEGLFVCCGVHVSTEPLVLSGVSVTPLGAEARLKVNAWCGMSGSVAVLVTVSVVNSLTVWLVGVEMLGRAFRTFSVRAVAP